MNGSFQFNRTESRSLRQRCLALFGGCRVGVPVGLVCLNIVFLPLGCQSEVEPASKFSAISAKPETEATSFAPVPQRPPQRHQREELPVAAIKSQLGPVDVVANSNGGPPQVILSADHAATCLVDVDDAFPNLKLDDSDGQPQQLHTLVADRPAVVVFWNEKQPMSRMELAELDAFMAERQQSDASIENAIAIVAVHIGPRTEEQPNTQHIIHTTDSAGTEFAKIAATETLPRTFAVSADNRIAWFDLEYSRSTRRDLQDTIAFLLQ